MRHTFGALAILWAILTVAALLASFGVIIHLGLWAHLVPADLMYSAADALGLHINPHGLLLRSAHGPPFLGPLGLVVWFFLPTLLFTALALRVRAQH
jgi:hypothetical protein